MRALGTRLVALVATAGLVAGGLVAVASPSAQAASSPRVFSAGIFGSIPDPAPSGNCPQSNSVPLEVTFSVTGMPQRALADVRLTGLMLGHAAVGDITATLIAPDAASVVLFGSTGLTSPSGIGYSSNLVGPYSFADTGDPAPGGWWAAANVGSSTAVPSGTYRASAPGGPGQTGATVAITPAFAGVTNPNGTWKLRLVDKCNTDTGSVSAASLSLTPTDPDCTTQAAAIPPAQAAATAADAKATRAAAAKVSADSKAAKATKTARKARKAARKAARAKAQAVASGTPAQVAAADAALKRAKARLKKKKAALAKAKAVQKAATADLVAAQAARTKARADLTAAQAAYQNCLDN